MTPGARAAAAIAVLDRILAGEAAEKALTNWARGARYAGSSDRAEVRDIVFQCLRCRSSYAAMGGGLTGRGLVLGFARDGNEDPARVYFLGGPYAPPAPGPGELGHSPVGAAAHNLPEWLGPLMQDALGADFAAIATAMASRAPVFLRVNTRRASLARAQAMLQAEDITAKPHPLAKSALQVVHGERKIHLSKTYASGIVELQDVSSQAVIQALPLQDGQRVLDHCAGGGGKTLAMAAMARVQLFAHDANPGRMKDLPQRAARAGVTVSMTDHPEDAGPYDLVLTDVPCSGAGSWRRDPEGKWSLTEARLADLLAVQAGILDRAARMVRPGGVLAYATCSFLRCENEDQISAFLARSPGWALTSMHRFTPLQDGDGFGLALLLRS
jgi:16S rRNA (cytosine967-C5)-methyltransferase